MTNWLITGANRGLGFGLTEKLAKQGNTIFAGVRDLSKADHLKKLGENVHVVQLRSESEQDAKKAVEYVKSKVDSLDYVIANAGIAKYYNNALETPLSEFRDHFEVNLLGPVILAQAFVPLLKQGGKFIGVSTLAARIKDPLPVKQSAYGASKAGLNFYVAMIAQENPDIIAFVISPGHVQTDMGQAGAAAFGLKGGAPTTIEDSVNGQLAVFERADKSYSGKFYDFLGPELYY